MEIQATPFPGKSQPPRQKTTRKTIQAPKGNPKDPPVQSQRRVFGTTRNPNIPLKSIAETNISKTSLARPEKPQIKKPSIQVSPNKPKSTQTTTDKKSPEKNRANPSKKKKSVGFREEIGKRSAGFLQPEKGDGIGPRTPVVVSPAPAKPKRGSSTPYQSAERCSNCRFDRLETSAYWLGQIKLAESVGKHFVSAGFFRLALESKAEPIRSLRMELKRYVARHEYLSTEAEWTDVSVSYGLILQAGADAANNNNGSSNTPEHEAHEDTNNEQAMEPPET